MSSFWIALLALSTWRWWWTTFQALLSDLRSAADSVQPGPRAEEARASLASALVAREHVSLQRQLAFRGVARRVAARRRWQGGFGRRGL